LAVAGVDLPPSPINFFDHFLYPAQLFSAYWGYGASRPGWNDGMALGFGFAAVGLAVLALFLGWSRLRTQEAVGATLVVAPVVAPCLALSLATLPISALLWRFTGLHHTLTYPWQLLGLAGLCLSALAGASVRFDRRLALLPTYASLVVLTLLASYPYLEPRFTQQPPRSPLAAWDAYHVMLLNYGLSVEIPPSAAGLSEPTPGRLPLADYGSPRAGDTLHLVFTWQITRPFERDMKLFLHVKDPSGGLIAQTDPLAGAGRDATGYFTSRWEPGELILDDVSLNIPPNAPPGPYRLAFGLYDGDTLERLPVVGREDGQVEIEVSDRDWRLDALRGDETQSLEPSTMDTLEHRP
jgi:hypothetical protein